MRSPHRCLDARRCRSSWHYKSAIIHVQPIASANKFIRGVSRERAIGFSTKVRFVKRVIKAYAYSRDVLKGTLTSFVAIFINASARTLCLLPNSLHLRLHKLGLYSKRVLKVLRPTQLLINAWVAAMFFSA